MRLLILILLIFMAGAGLAQSSKKKKRKASSESAQQSTPTSLDPAYSQENHGPKKSEKKRSKGATYNSEREYYERLEALDKTRQKNERMSEKPQYSNPLYFGHKRPPKKRSPDKMKFCKVCGIRH